MIFPDHHYHDDDNLFGDDDEREDHDGIMLNNEDIWLSTNITMFLKTWCWIFFIVCNVIVHPERNSASFAITIDHYIAGIISSPSSSPSE